MAAFAVQVEAVAATVEVDAVLHQFGDAVGGFADGHLHHLSVADAVASHEGVFHMLVEAVEVVHHSGNAALSSAVSIDYDVNGQITDEQDPATLAESVAEDERIRRIASDKLSDFESKVFSMRLNDMSYTEIAEKLGCPEKSVDNALMRIRTKLRNII